MAAFKPYLIGIAGPSCSGKTALANVLAGMLPAPSRTLALDSYYRDLAHLELSERALRNFDEPKALDDRLLAEQIAALARGEAVEQPVYLFDVHTRSQSKQRLEPEPFLIIEGLFVLYWEPIRRLLGTSVYIQIGERDSFERRLERDTVHRGRTADSVRLQFEQTVAPMSRLHLEPTRAWADVVVSGTSPLAESAARILEHVHSRWRPQASPTESKNEPLVNWRVLGILVYSWGEKGEEVARDLIRTFLTDAPGRLSQLRQGVEERAWEKAETAAHSLKGSAGQIGASSLAARAAEVEALVKGARSATDFAPALQKLEDELARLETHLSARLAATPLIPPEGMAGP